MSKWTEEKYKLDLFFCFKKIDVFMKIRQFCQSYVFDQKLVIKDDRMICILLRNYKIDSQKKVKREGSLIL